MEKDLKKLVKKYAGDNLSESESESWRDIYSEMKRDMEARGKLDPKTLKQIESDYNKLVSGIKKIRDMKLFVFGAQADIVGEDLNIEYNVSSDFDDWDDVSGSDARKIHAQMEKLLTPIAKSVGSTFYSVDSPGIEEDWVGVWFTYPSGL